MIKTTLRLSLATFLCASLLQAQTATPVVAQQNAPAQTADPAIKDNKPAIHYLQLGRSVRGRSITGTVFGTGAKRVIVLGGIHGDEPASAVVAKALEATLRREPPPPGLTVIIVAEVNPDGLVAETRINAAGVDINRNFPSTSWQTEHPDENHYPGAEPASEPETRAILKLLSRHPPGLLLTLHAALGCVNWDGPAEAMAGVMARANGYELCPYLGYNTPGSLGTYAGTDLHIPMVTIELRDSPAGDLVRENLPALRAALAQFAAE